MTDEAAPPTAEPPDAAAARLLAEVFAELRGHPDATLSAARAALTGPALRLRLALLIAEVRADAAAEERRWVAREIHDGVIQSLAALGYTVDEVQAVAETDGPEVAAALGGLRQQLSAVLRELRQTLAGLRSGVDASTSLGGALTEVAGRLADRNGWQVHLDVTESGARLPPDVEAELLRIASEALVNVGKHARASQVELTCHISPPQVLIRIADDGVGVGGSPRPSQSYGFVTMRERAQRVGASLSVQERRSAGTSIEVRLDSASGPEAAASCG